MKRKECLAAPAWSSPSSVSCQLDVECQPDVFQVPQAGRDPLPYHPALNLYFVEWRK